MVSRLIAEYSPVVPAKAGTHIPEAAIMAPRFRGDDGFPAEESISSSPLHRAFLVIGILPIFDRGVLQRGLQISVLVLLHLHDVEVLDREVVVVELERTAHRLEVGLAQRGAHGVLVLALAAHIRNRRVDELDGVVAERSEGGGQAVVLRGERGDELLVLSMAIA